MKKLRIFRNMKAISPVISVLLMIAVAVVASLVAYAWVMGYMNFQTDRTGHAIVIQATNVEAGNLTVYVQNVGTGQVDLGSIYVDGAMVTNATGIQVYLPNSVAEGSTGEIKINGNGYDSADRLAIKVVTIDGTYMEYIRNP